VNLHASTVLHLEASDQGAGESFAIGERTHSLTDPRVDRPRWLLHCHICQHSALAMISAPSGMKAGAAGLKNVTTSD